MAVFVRKFFCNSQTNKLLLLLRDVRCYSTCMKDNILSSGLPDIDIPKVRIDEYIFDHFQQWDNNKIATECPVTGRKYTYNDIYNQTNKLNKALRKKLKLNKGDVVALLLPNIPEFPIAALGVLKAGLVATTLNPIYTADEIARQLVDSSAKAIITLNDFWKLAHSSIELANQKLPILTIRTQKEQSTPTGAINFDEFTHSNCDIDDVKDVAVDDIAILPYSSGTTGLPKGVELMHSNIVANLCQLTHPDVTICEVTSENHQDVVPAVLPMFHIYGLTATCFYLLTRGCKIITIPKFTPDLYVSILAKQKPHVLFLAPPIAIFLANHPSVTKDHLSSIRTIMCGAAPLGALDEAKLLKKAEKHINMLQGYGLTETSPLVCSSRISLISKLNISGSIGTVCSNTFVKIVPVDDPNGKPLGPNEPGELLVKGPQVMKGYHNRPEETAKTLVNGWLHTGDMMYYDENGLFYVTDRLKELIKVKGFQVPPAELEEIIRDFQNVADAAVIGIPHKVYGEVPRAYVVPKVGTTVEVAKLLAFVNDKVASYKQIKGGISVVESIPKNASGKIMRRELKAQYEKERQ